jgi:hypothetical protein
VNIHSHKLTPPTVVSTTPAAGSPNIDTQVSPTVTMSEPVDPTTVNITNLKALDGSQATVSSTVALSSDGKTMTIDPIPTLVNGVTYTIRVSGVKDLAGNTIAATFNATFTTITSPSVTSTTPANAATNVAISIVATVIFSIAMTLTP